MMPPVLVPVAAVVTAKTRRGIKYVEINVTLGNHMRPCPRPIQSPWARKICQYSVARLVMKVPKPSRTAPAATTVLAIPASVARPESVEMNNRQNTWKPPIQEMSDGL
jgi:hypothetical protein